MLPSTPVFGDMSSVGLLCLVAAFFFTAGILFSDGGAIEVESNNPDDEISKAAIRRHMQKIAGMFGQGDFSLPMFIHDSIPPGVEVMKRLKDQIVYTTDSTARGTQVRITTSNPKALAAIHEFLCFQIKDHRTGDPLLVQPNPSP